MMVRRLTCSLALSALGSWIWSAGAHIFGPLR
jgi:hypothetical protein